MVGSYELIKLEFRIIKWGVNMPYIKGKDTNLYYEDIGIGETIIFLHSSFSRGILSFLA